MILWQTVWRRRFGAVWLGLTISSLGDQMSLTTFIWLALQTSHHAASVAGIVVAYTAPLWLGGFIAGSLLDRFPPHLALIADNLLRGAIFALIAFAGFTGHFSMWMLYVGAGTCGLLRMISLAGIPSVIPTIVEPDEMGSANALESISFQAAAVLGPIFAGMLLARAGGFVAIGIDALSYLLFVACLTRVPATNAHSAVKSAASGDLRHALRFIVGMPALLAITIMFMFFNIGEGALTVLMPIFTTRALNGGASSYGYLLGLNAFGSLVSTVIAGTLNLPRALGRIVAVFQICAGVCVLGLLVTFTPIIYAAFFALGVFAGPLTVWAQTLRMRVIPHEMRGRVFAILRTFMQATPPLGATLAAFAFGFGQSNLLIAAVAALIGLPAAIALFVSAFYEQDSEAITTA